MVARTGDLPSTRHTATMASHGQADTRQFRHDNLPAWRRHCRFRNHREANMDVVSTLCCHLSSPSMRESRMFKSVPASDLELCYLVDLIEAYIKPIRAHTMSTSRSDNALCTSRIGVSMYKYLSTKKSMLSISREHVPCLSIEIQNHRSIDI